VLTENIDPHDGLIEIRICTLSDIIIQVFLVTKYVHPFEYEIKQRLQVLRTGTGDKDIRVTVGEGSGDG
jgi:hypothetical protein